MPKDQTLLAPLWDVQTKALDLVARLDLDVFQCLGLIIAQDRESWKQDLEHTVREKNEERRTMTMARLRVYSQRARAQNAPVVLHEAYTELMGKFVAVNSQLDKLTDIYGKVLSLIPRDDPRKKIINAEVDAIEANMVDIREIVEELRDEVPTIKKALDFLSLPEEQFETALEALKQPLGFAAVVPIIPVAERIARLCDSRQKGLKDIQAMAGEAATTWLDSKVSRSQQRKVLRDVQSLLARMQGQEKEQDDLLAEIEDLRGNAILAPDCLTYRPLGSIEISDLLSAMEEFADAKLAKTGLMAMLEVLLNKVTSFLVELRPFLEGDH